MHARFKFIQPIWFLFVVWLMNIQVTYAKELYGSEANSKVKGAELVRINDLTEQIQYVLFREDYIINANDALTFISKLYQAQSPFGFRLIKTETDALGYSHSRYQQTLHGADVLGGVIITHIKEGKLQSFNGEYFKVINSQKNEYLSEAHCLNIALDSTAAESYMWQHPEEELAIKNILNDEKATWYPKAQLFYVPNNLIFNSQDFILCYRFNIHGFSPRTAENIYVSVADGLIIARENQLHTTDVPGKAFTKYSGQKTIITDSTAPFNYRLRENSRGNGVYTFNMKKGTSYGAASDFLDSNNIWNNVNLNKDEVATDCHWGAETTYDYYKNIHNRNSYNNNNARINSFVHYANNYDNAFWDGIRMTYGDGNVFKPLTSLDVCGHEITHAVTTNTANLIYSYESGQLNESFSDIFGNTIERYGKPSSYSWIIGEEITNDGTGLRNMLNPKLKGHPRCYKSTNWYFGTGDNGGVHLNSGVQNWWYYLLTEGGSGTNDVSNVYQVDSMGISTAEKIAYRNLSVYLTPTSQYADARFYSIRSAVDLYGNCSKEVIAVTNAWYACNVGPKYDSGFVKADFIADSVICNISQLVNFRNLSTNALSSKWYFGDGNSSNVFDPTHTFSNYGSYTIKLVSSSCFQNKKDSLTKVAYVKVDSTFDICNAVFMPLSGIDSTNKCDGFVYDDGREGEYAQNRITYFRISVPGADSIRIQFKDFDYETGYDSLYIYKGIYPGSGVKIAGYTGINLPNTGNSILVPGSVVTLRHVSDPYVVGRGFKLYYKAIRKPLDVKAYSDTSICLGTSVVLKAVGSGGYFSDYRFKWLGISYADSITVSPDTTQTYQVYLTDVCSQLTDSTSVKVTVLDALELFTANDTVICAGTNASLKAFAKGGKSNSYQFDWDNGIGTGALKSVNPSITTTYRVILNDACTPIADTAFITVRVKDALKVEIATNDTDICFNKMGAFTANGSGGDTMGYSYTWNNSMGMGSNQMAPFTSSKWISVTLKDNCSSIAASDSVFVNVRNPLSVNLNSDTTLCNGRGLQLQASVTGGKPNNYNFTWNAGVPDTAKYTVVPTVKTTYVVEVNDNCSDNAKDSIVVDLFGPIQISGLKDSLICVGQQMPFNALVSGGISSDYTYTWNLGLGNSPNQLVSPNTNTLYRLIVTDACTVLGDTAFVNVFVNPALRARIETDDTLLCFNKLGQYKVVGIGGISTSYNYNWNLGLGSVDSAQGSFTDSVWIVATITDGCTVLPGVDSVFVAVRPKLEVTLGPDSTICHGVSVDLNATGLGGNSANYNLTWNNGLSNSSSHRVQPNISTWYTVLIDDNCSDVFSDSIYISVLEPLKVNGLRDTTICYGGSANLNPSFTGGKPTDYMYTWDNGLPQSPSQIVSPNSTTKYNIKLDDFCTLPYDSAFVTVTVLSPLVLNASFLDSSICSGDTAQLNITMNGGRLSTRQWLLNGNSITGTQVKLSPLVNSNYVIELQDGCSNPVQQTRNLVVNPLPIVNFDLPKTDYCIPELIQFQNLSSGAVAYRWSFSDGDSSFAFEPLKGFELAGQYDVRLMAISNENCVDSMVNIGYVNVLDQPIADFTFLPNQLDFLNSTASFQNNSKFYDNFNWSFGDNSSDNTNTDPIHTYQDTGTYPVKLFVSNSIGCKDTAEFLLRVWDIYRLYIPTAISVNQDNINDSFVILGRGIQDYRLRIFTRWGEMIYDGDSNSKPFNGRDSKGELLIKGTYLIDLTVRDFGGFMHYVRQTLEIL
ncbi:MAG: M4 family metallopeptidase [Bacteroidia bacterium]|nr:M4 family metallopeptidase [Bacteroidia bacterium]